MSRTTWRLGAWWTLTIGVALFLSIAVARGLFTLPALVGPAEDMRTGPRTVAPGNVSQASFVDYRDTVWLPVRDLQAGGNPYDAPAYAERHPYAFEFTYLPAQLVLFFPLAQLPWEPSAVTWFVALILSALVLAVVAVVVAGLPRRVDVVLAIGSAILLVKPMGWMIQSGQTSIVPLTAAVWAMARRRNDAATTLCIALAWLKPQYGLPLVLLLWLLDARTAVVRGTVLAGLVSLPAAAWAAVNAGGLGPFLASLPTGLEMAVSERSTQFVTPDLSSLLGHVLDATGSTVLIAVCFVVVMGLGGLAIARIRSGGGPIALVTVLGITTVLLSVQHQDYDLVALVPLIVVCAAAATRSWSSRDAGPAAWWTALAVLLALAVVPRGLTSVQVRELQLTLGLAVLAILLVWATSSSRRAAVVAVITGAAVLALLRYGIDLLGAAPGTEFGMLSSTALFAAWLLALLWVLLSDVRGEPAGPQLAVGSVAGGSAGRGDPPSDAAR